MTRRTPYGHSAHALARRWAADGRLPEPFHDTSVFDVPRDITEALAWAEYIMMSNGIYRSALERVVSYFLTDIEIVSPTGSGEKSRIGREEKEKYTDFLNNTLGIKQVLRTVALDYLTYGNSFTSLLPPFRRYLRCGTPGCGFEAPFSEVADPERPFKFQWRDYKFYAVCPMCKRRGEWYHNDRRSSESDRIKVKRWSPHEIDILWDAYSDDTSYIWKIPQDYRTAIKRGDPFQLERAPWEIIEAVKNNQNLLFDPDIVYHMREDVLAGIAARGWGISRVLVNFRQACYVQLLHWYNESIVFDHVVPFRVITPMPRPGAAGEVNDPVRGINMGSFTSRVLAMIHQHRIDPGSWHVLPFPLQYQAIGGDASQLAPKDLIELGMDALLTAVGVPVELYKGSLSVQAAPAALRLFEACWSHLIYHLNKFLDDLVGRISRIMGWEPVGCRLQRVTHADDINRQMAKLQLMASGLVSKTTGLKSIGLEFNEETRRSLEEERITAEASKEMQEEMQQEALMDQVAPPGGAMMAALQGGQGGQLNLNMQGMPGAVPNGGVPPQQGGQPSAAQMFAASVPRQPNVPTTPEEMDALAQQKATELLSMPEAQKDSALIRLKKEDPVMHALVRAKMDDMRRQAALQGREIVLQQMLQGG